MKNLILYGALLLTLIMMLTFVCDAKRRRKFCHTAEINRYCNHPGILITSRENGSGIPYTPRMFEDFCELGTTSAPSCARRVGKRCMTPLQRELMEVFITRTTQESYGDFCDPNGVMKKRFLKHAQCLHHVVKLSSSYRHECVMGMHAAGEHLHDHYSTNFTLTYHSFCCAYNRWENCISKYLTAWCGEGSPQGIIDLILTASGHNLPFLCPYKTFDPETDFCKQLLPPPFTPVKGYKTNAVLSWGFAFACPNVGYGIIDESDRHNWKVVQAFDPSKHDLVPDPIQRYTPIY